MVAAEGLHKAFVNYAAEDAVIMRSNDVVIGKAAIDKFYDGQDITGLSWAPEYIDVSGSGDMGYTYGHYTYSTVDSTGAIKESRGVFHTVWKRQEDGSWKFVWD
jgi:ketosteroid isomerase-like protein